LIGRDFAEASACCAAIQKNRGATMPTDRARPEEVEIFEPSPTPPQKGKRSDSDGTLHYPGQRGARLSGEAYPKSQVNGKENDNPPVIALLNFEEFRAQEGASSQQMAIEGLARFDVGERHPCSSTCRNA
jgi:hypothetical protein